MFLESMFTWLIAFSSHIAISSAGATSVKILSVDNAHRSDFFPITYCQMKTTTVSLEGGDVKECSTSSDKLSWRHGINIDADIVQVAGESDLHVYTDDGSYREFNPTLGSYVPFKSQQAKAPEGAFIADGVVPKEGKAFVFSYTDGKLSSVDVKSGDTTGVVCSIKGLNGLSWISPSYVASLQDGKHVVVAIGWPSHSKPGQLFFVDTSSPGTCASKSWTLQVGESFCGVAVDSSTKKAYALIEHHDLKQFPDPDCQNVSGTVDKFYMAEVFEDANSDSGLSGRHLLDMGGLGIGEKTEGRSAMYVQEEKIWLVYIGGSVVPVDVAAGKIGASAFCDLGSYSRILTGSASDVSRDASMPSLLV